MDMSRRKNETISDIDEIHQSIEDILTTPIGTRVLKRDYGSRLFDLIDSPLSNRMDFIIAAAEAIDKWEKRIVLTRIDFKSVEAGKVAIAIEGIYKPDNRPLTVEVSL
jgi:phage baseplate assembly protein W